MVNRMIQARRHKTRSHAAVSERDVTITYHILQTIIGNVYFRNRCCRIVLFEVQKLRRGQFANARIDPEKAGCQCNQYQKTNRPFTSPNICIFGDGIDRVFFRLMPVTHSRKNARFPTRVRKLFLPSESILGQLDIVYTVEYTLVIVSH
jgi:hypothetical protein